MDDLMDLFGDREKKVTKENVVTAPVELMSQFLVLISERKMKEALGMTNEILDYEPNNVMILEYRRSLTVYIDQGQDEQEAESSSSEESYGDNDDDDEDDNDSEELDDEEQKSDRK
mmetsp:Transcript_34691/g.33037  ORF Transcript_34691/g.33037 Transcript_34691/m.33037 type:complete len:116 (-) Transcript_34691:74-421(-)